MSLRSHRKRGEVDSLCSSGHTKDGGAQSWRLEYRLTSQQKRGAERENGSLYKGERTSAYIRRTSHISMIGDELVDYEGSRRSKIQAAFISDDI